MTNLLNLIINNRKQKNNNKYYQYWLKYITYRYS